jgi:predicted HTH domain antitoxin
MSTAQILYEQYKVLPPRIQRELKTLIIQDEEEKIPLVEQIREGMKEVRLIQAGKLKAKSADEFLAELREEINCA